jgi:hypothetical protein
MAVVKGLLPLAKILGAKTFEKKLQPVLFSALADHVASIRVAGCEQAGLLTREFGARWGLEKIYPAALALYDRNVNYLQRMTCMQVVAVS